jgi:hypothetical protein
MAIQTVLFGKPATVPTPEFLELMKRKEALVSSAATLHRAGLQAEAAKVCSKIISINRKIAKTGLYVTYL